MKKLIILSLSLIAAKSYAIDDACQQAKDAVNNIDKQITSLQAQIAQEQATINSLNQKNIALDAKIKEAKSNFMKVGTLTALTAQKLANKTLIAETQAQIATYMARINSLLIIKRAAQTDANEKCAQVL